MTGWSKEKAAKWDKYAAVPVVTASAWSPDKAAKWDKYGSGKKSGNDSSGWGELAAQSYLGGVAGIFDTPKAIAQGLEYIKNHRPVNALPGGSASPFPVGKPDPNTEYGRKLRERAKKEYGYDYVNPQLVLPEPTNYSDYIPTGTGALEKLGKYTGTDFTPKPSNYEQRIFSNAIGMAGGLGAAGSLGKLAKAGSGLQKFLGTNPVKQTALGAGIGGVSQTMQEEGVNPLVADIVSAVGAPAAGKLTGAVLGGGKNLLGALSPKVRQGKLEAEAGNILRKHIGDENVPQVLQRLDDTLPFNAEPITAELGKNVGLSKLHQAFKANNPQLLEKSARNDALIKNQIYENFPAYESMPYDTGSTVLDHMQGRYKGLVSKRSEAASPLYEAVRKLKTTTPTPNLRTYVDETLPFVVDGEEKALNRINKIISPPEKSSLFKTIEEYEQAGMSPEALKRLREASGHGTLTGKLAEQIKSLNGQIEAAYAQGDKAKAKYLGNIKNRLEKDLEVVPEELAARRTYAEHSPEINEIEQQPLLKKFIPYKGKEPIAAEEVMNKILSTSTNINDVKALMKQAGNNPETLNALRGGIANRVLDKIQLSSMNALGEQNLSYDKLRDFMTPGNKNTEKLKVMLAPEQFKVLESARDLLKRRHVASSMGMADKSNTQSETTLLGGLAGKGMYKFLPTGVESFVPGAKYFKDAYNQSLQELLKEALADPQKAKLLLSKSKGGYDQNTLDALMEQILPAVSNVAVNYSNQEGTNGL